MDDDRKVWLPSQGNGGSHPNWLALVKVSDLRKALAEIDTKETGHCQEGVWCVCGRDTLAARAGCRNWLRAKSQE